MSTAVAPPDDLAKTVREGLSQLQIAPPAKAGLAAVVSRTTLLVHCLLPLLFGGFTAWHYLAHQAWADGVEGTPGPIIYWLLMIVGAALTLMSLLSHISPPRPKLREGVALDAKRAPLLLDLLGDVAQRLDVPPPQCLAVWDSTLENQRSRLYVGASSLAILSTAEVIGVLAREMALDRSPGLRIGRAEYARLKRILGEREPGERETLLGKLLTFVGLLGRPIVWPLMVVVRIVVEGELRRAELEADALQCQLVGTRGFLSTIQRRRLVQYAVELATADLSFQHKDKSLRANRIATVLENAQTLPSEVQQSILETSVEEPHYDFQPTLAERVAAAQKQTLPGVLKYPSPARMLIADFDDLCREVTWLDAKSRFGPTLQRRDLKA